jgi:hypothetical protein
MDRLDKFVSIITSILFLFGFFGLAAAGDFDLWAFIFAFLALYVSVRLYIKSS